MDRHLERLGQKINKKIDMIGESPINYLLINCYDNIGLTKKHMLIMILITSFILKTSIKVKECGNIRLII